MQVQPYLWSFGGRCEEALEFYKNAVGAKVTMLMRFKDAPPMNEESAAGQAKMNPQYIMHAEAHIGGSTIMCSDGDCHGNNKFGGFSLSLSVDSVAEAEKAFAALSEGGQVRMPLAKTFYSPKFGMLTDRFGVGWMVVTVQKA